MAAYRERRERMNKALCKHPHLRPYHDNSILCLDCNEVIWQDLQGKDYPEEFKARFEKVK